MKKNTARIFSALLATVLCFTISGCHSTNPGTTTVSIDGTVETNAPTTPSTEATTAPTEETTAPTEEATEPTEETTVATEPTEPPHEHVYTREQFFAATCATGSYILHYCDCGATYASDQTAALGHNYVSEDVIPEDSLQGYTLHTCLTCNHSYKDNYIWVNLDEDTAFFNDAAFIGDSITQGLMYYCMNNGALGNATWLCVQSYSVNNAVTGALAPTYQGVRMSPEDALAACGANKVFIMLGMNDINLIGAGSIDLAMRNWVTLLSRIRAKNPNITIYIQSATPIYYYGQTGYLTNDYMDQYNQRLQEFAWANGCYYIDVATYMKDSNNSLIPQYCSDKYVHLNYTGIAVWVNVLKAST